MSLTSALLLPTESAVFYPQFRFFHSQEQNKHETKRMEESLSQTFSLFTSIFTFPINQ